MHLFNSISKSFRRSRFFSYIVVCTFATNLSRAVQGTNITVMNAESLGGWVFGERLAEDAFFDNAEPPKLPLEAIRQSWLRVLDNHRVSFGFRTKKAAYRLVLKVDNIAELSQVECQALAALMKVATRGSDIDQSTLNIKLETFRTQYGPVKNLGEDREGFLVYSIRAYPGPSEVGGSDKILHTSFSRENADIGSAGFFITSAFTAGGLGFRLVQTAMPEGKLSVLDCKVFCDAMALLGSGNCISHHSFLQALTTFRSKYNTVETSRSDDGRFLIMVVVPTLTPCLSNTSTGTQPNSIQANLVPLENNSRQPAPIKPSEERPSGKPDHITSNISVMPVEKAPAQPQPVKSEEAVARHSEGPVAKNLPTPPEGKRQEAAAHIPLVEKVKDSPVRTIPQCPYPRITFTAILKEGGQAQVYAGTRGDQKVAIKVFSAIGGVEDAISAYKTELRMLLKMSRHPNVVEVLEFFENPRPALVTRLIDGEDLMDYLRRHGRCNEEEGRKLAVGIARGLCHLHRHGVIHRDLKSLNILRQKDGMPIIIDLGLGSILERQMKTDNGATVEQLHASFLTTDLFDKTQCFKGTVAWVAPEMITEQVWSAKTDVYAYGIILWELFSGKRPYVQPDEEQQPAPLALLMRIVSGERPDMSAVSHVSGDLQGLIQICWHSKPSERPSMKRVIQMLCAEDPKEVFASFNISKTGALNFGEFAMFLQQYAPLLPSQGMHAIFVAADADKSGDISLTEFEAFWSLGEPFWEMSEKIRLLQAKQHAEEDKRLNPGSSSAAAGENLRNDIPRSTGTQSQQLPEELGQQVNNNWKIWQVAVVVILLYIAIIK